MSLERMKRALSSVAAKARTALVVLCAMPICTLSLACLVMGVQPASATTTMASRTSASAARACEGTLSNPHFYQRSATGSGVLRAWASSSDKMRCWEGHLKSGRKMNVYAVMTFHRGKIVKVRKMYDNNVRFYAFKTSMKGWRYIKVQIWTAPPGHKVYNGGGIINLT